MRLRPVIRCCVLAGLLVLPLYSQAVGLGRLTLQSGLGQALSAEIELTSVQPGELDTLSARLADQATYGRNKIDFTSALTRVRIALEPRGGRPVLKVTSTQPVNEPFLDLLIELNWASGRIVREYTFLLDPPGYAATAPVEPAPAIATESLAPPVAASSARPAPAPPGASTAASSNVAPPDARPAPAGQSSSAAPAPSSAQSSAQSAAQAAEAATEKYGPVRRGETLARIAAKVKPAGVTLEQMLSALYRANAQAFDGKNMNRLRAGPMLSVPKAEDISSVPHPEARKEIRVQAADWRAYRERLAASLAPSEGQSASGRSPSGGRITTAINEKSAPAPGSDRLKLSKGESVSGTIAGAAGTAARAENAVAAQKAAAEANSRVVDLERQLKNMQRLLELKSPAMAGQQATAELSKTPAKGSTTSSLAPVTPPVGTSPLGAGTATQSVTPMATGSSPPPATAASKAAEPGKTDPSKAPTTAAVDTPKLAPTVQASSSTAPAPAPSTTASSSASTPAPSSGSPTNTATPPAAPTPGSTTPASGAAQPASTATGATGAAKAKPAMQPAPQSAEPSILDELMGNTLLLIGVPAAVLLALLYVLIARRRRNSTTKFEDSMGAATDLRTSTVFGNTGGGVVNTGDNSLVSDFSREGMGNIDTGDVDPIAEAEVYLAYGRDNQAEEILRDALTKTPERQEIRLKLLEIYAQQNKTAAFEATATEIFSATRGNGEIWTKAAQLGRTIDADNPLYAPKGGVVDTSMSSAPSTSLAASLSTVSRNDRLSDSNLRVAEAVERSAAETGFDFTGDPKKEMFVMAPSLAPSEAVRAIGTPPKESSFTDQRHSISPSPSSSSPSSPGAGGLTASLAAAATASVAAAAASRASAVRERAPLDFKLDSGPEESTDPAPPTMDFVTLDGPITLTGATTLSGPSTLSGVTLASPSGDIWGEKPQPTLGETVSSNTNIEAPVDRKGPPHPAADTPAKRASTTASAPDTISPMTRAGRAPEIAIAPPATQSGGHLDLDKLDLTFDPDHNALTDDPTPSVLDGQWHDAATKLDLAKAYQEMGDVDGAREILQEVMQEGDDQQKKEAQTFLSKLRA